MRFPEETYTHAAGGMLTVVMPLETYPDGLYQSTPTWTLPHPVGEYTHAPAAYREPAVTGTVSPEIHAELATPAGASSAEYPPPYASAEVTVSVPLVTVQPPREPSGNGDVSRIDGPPAASSPK